MPLYEYKCRSCSKTEDVRHGFKEDYNGKCAVCGGEMARVFTPTGIVFKGSGFYLTDSRKAEAAGSGGGGSGTPATPGASADGSTPAASTPTPTPTPAPAAAPAAPAASKSESAA